jgi:tetratricopeptide (TPR) repeat protein
MTFEDEMKRLLLILMACFVLSLPVYAIGEPTPTPGANTPTMTEEQALSEASQALFNSDYDEVVEILSAFLASNPDSAESYILRSYAYQALAQNDLALDDVTQAIDLIPYNWTYFVTRGDVYVAQGDDDKALLDYDRAIDLNPRYTIGYFKRGELLDIMGNAELGELNLLMATALSLGDNGDYDEAIETYSQLIEQAPNSEKRLLAYAYYNRSLSYFTLSDFDKSMSDINAATEYYSDMHDIYLLRGTLFNYEGDTERAGEDFYRRITLLAEDTVQNAYSETTTVLMAYGNVYTFTFEAQAGDVYDFRAIDVDGGGVDPLIAILDPEGNAIAGDDDAGGGVENLDSLVEGLELPMGGTYTLVVSHANGGYDGNVRVRITQQN